MFINKDDKNLIEMVKILRSYGIEMSVFGCGCCDSPSVTFTYQGKIIFEGGSACFDTEDYDKDGAIYTCL